MQVEGVNATNTTNSGAPPIAQNNNVNSGASVGDSNISEDGGNGGSAHAQNNVDNIVNQGDPGTLKSMSTSDFLLLHETYRTENKSDNIMNKMMKMKELKKTNYFFHFLFFMIKFK